VEDAARLGVVDKPDEQRDLVVPVDPRHVLMPARDRAAQAEPERRQELAQEAARRVEHEPRAGDGDADARALGLARRRLPRRADPGVEARTGLAGLVDDRVPVVAVVAYGGLAVEHLGSV